LTQIEVNLLLDSHEKFLAGRPGGRRASHHFVDFSGLDLAERNLSDADFTGSVFDDCRMVRIRLERATLFGCSLMKADLRGAVLVRADMRGVRLGGADLAYADLTQADFREGQITVPHHSKGLQNARIELRTGDLDQAHFGGATLDGSDLTGVSAFKTDFSDCSLRGARLTRANLKDANLSGAMMDNAVVAGANMEGANLQGAVVAGVELQGARGLGFKAQDWLLASSAQAIASAEGWVALAAANREWCMTGGKAGAPALFDGLDLRPLGARLKGAWLTAMSARGACLIGLDLSGCQLQGANLADADLRGVDFKGADLRGAKLAGANLTKADLRQATFGPLPLPGGRSNPVALTGARLRYVTAMATDFTGAVLDEADLRCADFTGARLGGVSLTGANMDDAVGLKAS
jgi:uncharacterized protein YjbI with pentapeptide repeats